MSSTEDNNYKSGIGTTLKNKLNKEWYRSHSKRDRTLFESILIVLLPLIFLFVYTLTKGQNEDGYFKIHSALFVCSMFVFLLAVLRRNDFKEMIQNSWKVVTNFSIVGLIELIDILFLITLLLSFISVLFVIDLSFMSNYGVRIGAVASVGLFRVLKSVLKSFK